MTYLDRINHLWNLRRNGQLSGPEHELMSFLLDSSNRLGWKNPFAQTNALICGLLGTSEKTLIASRNRLKQDGLIDFQSGKKKSPTTYRILSWKMKATNSSENDRGNDRENDSESVASLDTRAAEKSKSEEQDLPEAKASSSPAAAADKPESGGVIAFFHSLCPSLPRVRELTPQRKTAIRARWKASNGRGLEWFKELFIAAEASDFLSGRNGEWAGCAFDWLMNPTNAQKVLEGNYNNDRQKQNNHANNHRLQRLGSTPRPALVPGSDW